MKLKDIDLEYRESIASPLTKLKEVANAVRQDYQFDLDSREVSDAILERLKCFYETQKA